MMNSPEVICGNEQKFADKDSSSAAMALQDGNNLKPSTKDNEARSVARRNTNDRCGYFTLLTPDPNGNWRAMAVPFNCLDVRIHAGSHAGSQSFTDGNFSRPRVQYQSRSKSLTNKSSRRDAFSGKSGGYSSFNNGSSVTNLSDIQNGSMKMVKPGKKNNTKKGKKGKKDQKFSPDSGSNEVTSVHGSAINEGGGSKNTDLGTGSISWETTSTVLSPDSCSYSSDDNCGGSANCSKADDVAISSSSNGEMGCDGSRDVPRNSVVYKKSSSKKVCGHSTEKINTSWREVRTNGIDNCGSGFRKVNSFDYQDINSSNMLARKNHHVSQSKLISKGEDAIQSRFKNPGKSKKKTSVGSKQELSCHSRTIPYASKSTSNLCTEIGTELDNAVDISPYVGRIRGLAGISRPLSKVDLEGLSGKVESLEQIYSPSSSDLNSQTIKQECKSIPSHLEDCTQTVFFKLTGTEGLGRGKDDQVSGPSMPKNSKDTELDRLDLSSSSQFIDKESVKSFKLENLGKGKDDSSVEDIKHGHISGPYMHNHIPVSIKDSELARSDLIKSSQCVDIEAEGPLGNVSVDKAGDNDPVMIMQAVNEAYKAQLASEAVEKVIGCPALELERFLHAASPVIPVSNNISRCGTCSHDDVSVTPLCRRNIPNLSLGSMWQWYEKHGTFGLEVKAEDFDNSKRLGIDRFMFRAYFVPFLSAVQLFRPQKVRDADVACKLAGNPSCNGGLPIFSVLVPQPKKVGNVTEQCNDSTSLDELELVYEYFEAERPQHRRPLFEMIKDLVGGDEPLQGKAFGDPSKLISMAMNDIHPKSWYSVAWYPIYRIPDEKFQSAFLTYHSLGHLLHKSASSVVSPVVGLQSYNTQGECWLRPRSLPEESPNSNYSEILKERLRTLEHTASVMARAEVVKENETSVNIQPDYEFFLSRRR